MLSCGLERSAEMEMWTPKGRWRGGNADIGTYGATRGGDEGGYISFKLWTHQGWWQYTVRHGIARGGGDGDGDAM